MKEVVTKRTITITGAIAVLLACLGLLAHTSSKPTGVELSIFRAINNLPDGLRVLLVPITETATVFALALLLVITAALRRYLLAIQLFVAGAGTYVFVEILKHSIARERPFVSLADVHQRVAESGYSFPSGHTAFATALSVTIALVLGGKWKYLPFVWIPLVALSRVYLGVHAPLDVLGSLAAGSLVAYGVHITRPLWYEKTLAFWLEFRRKAR